MVNIHESKPVLLIDDSADDALLLKRAFRRVGVAHPLVHLLGGEVPLEELFETLKRKGCSAPVLILLDIKMPLIDGFDVLKWVKSRADLVHTPTVMLTSSNLPQDIARAELLGADAFLTKPSDFEGLLELAESLKTRWLAPD